jgi:hypothetical protein
VFNQTERELTWIVLTRVTSIQILAPRVGAYPIGYATAVWRVVVKMNHDQVVRDFHASDHVQYVDELSAYNNARDAAYSFARSIAQQVDTP